MSYFEKSYRNVFQYHAYMIIMSLFMKEQEMRKKIKILNIKSIIFEFFQKKFNKIKFNEVKNIRLNQKKF